MCIENHMTGRLDVSLWTLDAHVVYFHSSQGFMRRKIPVYIVSTEQYGVTFNRLNCLFISADEQCFSDKQNDIYISNDI